MPLVLYNTYSKKEEEFQSIVPGKVSMYTCGPTVYGRPHIGNYSSFLMADLLRRWLEVIGYEVKQVKNITDVGHLVADLDEGEDKIEKQAKAEKIDPLAIARKYTEQYLEDEQALRFLEPFARPRATETIPQMIEIIQTLMEKGHAYETQDGVYFAVLTFPTYGALSGNMIEQLEAGARIDVDEQKKHPADFALWKKMVGPNAHHLLRWPSPWGEGFPGWHIECSAMARKFLGEAIDIHTGGEDNIFPHHECEIAQSECSGHAPFARFWLHKRRIEIVGSTGAKGGVKMSKSLGNVTTLPDVVSAGYNPLDLRYYLLSVHYRTRLKFSWKGLDDARKARRKVLEWMSEAHGEEGRGVPASPEAVEEWRVKFFDAMNADLNASGALAVIFECMTWSRHHSFAAESQKILGALIASMRHTFGCFEEEAKKELPEAISKLLQERATARNAKDFAASDRLRDAIAALGFDVKDTAAGQEVCKK
jgi:cysteinyl-tRNA synthetase